jgi:hypothetical protein
LPGGDALPTTAWNVGETWIDKVPLTLDAGAAAGAATVYVFVQDEVSDETVPVRADALPRDLTIKGRFGGNTLVHAVPLTQVQITRREQSFTLPSPQYPLQVNWDDKIKLLGYDLPETTCQVGAACPLMLYWQALDPLNLRERYTVFVHLLDASGALVAQKDAEPEEGRAPTTSWAPREVIADPYSIELPGTLAPGEYALEVGLYQAASGKRLPIVGTGADHLALAKIRVVAR